MTLEQIALTYMPTLVARRGAPALFTALFLLGAVPPADAKATVTTFDPEGSTNTQALSINESGAITGYFVDGSSVAHGFLRAVDGTITTFDPEGSLDTYASGINKSGAIVGTYVNGQDVDRGFLRAADGTITTWRVKPQGTQFGTDASCINDAGVIAGGDWWWDLLEEVGSAYVRKADGRIVSFEPFGGSAGINKEGAITGSVEETLRAKWSDGFVRAPDGTITEFNVLGMPYNTYAKGINNPGAVVGNYVDASGVSHGYARAVDGTITTFDVSQSTGTYPNDISDKGWIAGDYTDRNGVSHGFADIKGKFGKFDPPESTDTFAYSINNGGSIAGDYIDGNGVYHGFVRIPQRN